MNKEDVVNIYNVVLPSHKKEWHKDRHTDQQNRIETQRMQTGAATLENNVKVLQKVKNRTTLQPAIDIVGIYAKDTKIQIRRGTCTTMFIAAL